MTGRQIAAFTAVLVAIFFAIGIFRSPQDGGPEAGSSPTDAGGGTDASLTDDWTLYKSEEYKLALAYPIEFTLTPKETLPAHVWRINSAEPGEEILNILIPASFDPNSNFLDSGFNAGLSRDPEAVRDCLAPDPSGVPNNASGTAENINNVGYIKFLSVGAGAGNIYEVMSWRTLRGNTCYAFEGIIHSTHVGNYPAEENRHEFDREKIKSLLEEIMRTVTFL